MSGERVPVELHIVSDSTGETAQRLVLALEAQFPDQPFEEIRHPRVENVDDLHITVQQARGRPAVMSLYAIWITHLAGWAAETPVESEDESRS